MAQQRFCTRPVLPALAAQASCQRLRPHLGPVLFQFPANFRTTAAAKGKGQPPINNIDRLRRLGEVRGRRRCLQRACARAAPAGRSTRHTPASLPLTLPGCAMYTVPDVGLPVVTSRALPAPQVLPAGERFVFEFRDASWFCREVYEVLARHNWCLAITVLTGVAAGDAVYGFDCCHVCSSQLQPSLVGWGA